MENKNNKELCSLECIYCQTIPATNYELNEDNVKIAIRGQDCQVRCTRAGYRIKKWQQCEFFTRKKKYNYDIFQKPPKIIVFIGESASGKDTAINYMNQKYGFKPIVSHTTRPMRDGETQDKEYHFCSLQDFEKMKKNCELIEERKYNTYDNSTLTGKNTWYYGVNKKELDDSSIKVCALDLQGLEAFKKYYGSGNIITVYISVEDKIREKRAKKRGGFNQKEWNRRLLSDSEIFSQDVVSDLVNITIENNKKFNDFKIQLDKLYDLILYKE